MKYYSIICFVLMLTSGSTMCQVSVDEALIKSSEVMKPKRDYTLFSRSLDKVAFGPFKIVDIYKGKRRFKGREKGAFYEIKGKKSGVMKSVSTKTSQPFLLSIVQDSGDSIFTDMNLITVKGGNHALIEISNSKAPDEENVSSYCADMHIQIGNDTLTWQMLQTNDAEDNDFPLSYDRVLTNGADMISVKGAEDFPIRGRFFKKPSRGIGFVNPSRGMVFVDNEKQVAALQLYPETLIWIKNGINENHKQAIAAVMISLLSITNLRK